MVCEHFRHKIWRAPWEESKAKSWDFYHLERRSYVRFNLAGSSHLEHPLRTMRKDFESLLELLICLCKRVLRPVKVSTQSEKVTVIAVRFQKNYPTDVRYSQAWSTVNSKKTFGSNSKEDRRAYQSLVCAIKREWKTLATAVVNELVQSMNGRVSEVIESNGNFIFR